MKRIILLLAVNCGIVLSSSAMCHAADAIEPKEKVLLFDGKTFDGWFRYLRNNQGDVDETWKVKTGGILACAGEPRGYIRTVKAYKNYKLHVEYRWPGKTGNNGILVHMVGEDKVWPRSLECQGGFHNQGDFWEIGGLEFNEHKIGGHRVRGRRVLKYGEHNEKEAGQWNVYEVWCVGGTVRPYVNGKLMNEASDCAVTEGKICLQSEGAPIEFRNIYIEPTKDIPWPVEPTKKIVLFNGKDLDGWVRFSPGDKRDADKKWTVDKVRSIRDGVIRCQGVPNGYIRTVESYANYKLHLEWRWPAKPTNSGVLLHSAGIDKTWPKCVEAQLMHENAGDFWLLSYSSIKADGKQVGPEQYANAKKKRPSNEKPPGQWNSYDIVCDGKTVTLFVNGLLQNKGTEANPSYGPICLQSEGSPIEFRNIYLEPIKSE
ncbi:MAG: 3-keto-disaccharide hydrolase [Planctomycetota bacterium]